MSGSRLAKRCTAWFVCLTILLGSALPAFGYALGSALDNPPLIEICSPLGSRFVQLDASGDQTVPSAQSNRCIWCSFHETAIAPPPSGVSALEAPRQARMALSRAFDAAPRPLPIWTSAAPRAPPVLS